MSSLVRRHRVAALLCAGVLTTAACGGDEPTAEPAPAESAPADSTPAAGDDDTPTPVTTAPPDVPATDAPDAATPDSPDDEGAGGESAAETTEPPAATEPPISPDASPDVPEILQVSGPVVGGGELDLADYADRPLLLWFWAPF